MSEELIRFEDFELDPRAYQMRRSGRTLKLERIPMEVLLLLAERRGQLVTREEIIEKLWGKDVFLDTDNAINTAIRKIRQVLKDDPEQPRFVQTITGKGYRFIALVTVAGIEAGVPERETDSARAARTEQAATGTDLRKRWMLLVAATVALAALALAGYLYFHRAPKLTDRDTIVLADFANSTGDPVFDETLRQGLAVQLGQSPFLSLISDERIQQMLKLMAKPTDARLTPAVSREICERTASAAVLDGSIASLGSQYVLTLRAKDCRSGDILDEEQVQAARKEDVLNALSQIASGFRTRVVESLSTVKIHDTPLAEATTPSLEALKAYSVGWQVSFSSGSAAAVPFLKHAIEIDPNFASAYAALGRMYGDIGESALSAKNIGKAYELRDRASDQERFFISLNYDLQVTGNLEKAQQTCDLWMQAYPRAWMPHALLSGGVYPQLGKYEKSVEEAKIAIGVDPDFSIGYALALSGESSRSQTLTDDLSRRFPEDTIVRFTYLPTLRALLALNRHQPANAVELLQTAIPYEGGVSIEGGSEYLLGEGTFYSVYARGVAYLAARRGQEAAAEFQKILDHRGIVISDPVGPLAQMQLGRAHALAGDKDNAGTAYTDFLSLWEDADPDIPILKEVQREYASLQ